MLDSLAIPVGANENRAVSFTNKRSAFYYTQTHRNDHPEHAFFRGFNIAGRRIFSDYQLRVAGVTLDPQAAKVVVRPDAVVRTYPQGITETLRLFDGQDLVEVEVSGAKSDVRLQLSGDTVTRVRSEQGSDEYTATQAGDSSAVDHIVVGRSSNRFWIAVGPSSAAARRLFEQSVAKPPAWETARRARLERVVSGDHSLWSDNPRLTQALRWLQLTMDSLVTRQRGDGIYAGLPWFNEYWGRDSFISLPGEPAPRLTGTYLQGWSNSEQLRVWYQGLLGIQPDLEQGVVRLAPRLPTSFGHVAFNSRIGAGVLSASYEHTDRGRRYTWRLQGQAARLELDIAPFEQHWFSAAAGDTLVVEQTAGSLIVHHAGTGGIAQERVTLVPAPTRREQQALFDAILAGTEFAKPGVAAAHPAMRQSRTP